jgi:hypothetical protein
MTGEKESESDRSEVLAGRLIARLAGIAFVAAGAWLSSMPMP